MTNDRRYNEHEISLILEQAGAAHERAQDTSTAALSVGARDGLTLAQLQEIGREVGIDPVFVESAANAVASGLLVPTKQRTWLGLPIGIARTIDFGRNVSDDEWDRIVVTLRETFEARGKLQRDGTFRQWTNGNLQALLEPTATGHRLRLSTRKGNVTARVVLGGTAIIAASIMWLGALSRGGDVAMGALLVPAIFGALGIGSLLSIGLQLPRWARTRASQMETIAAQAINANRVLPESGGSRP